MARRIYLIPNLITAFGLTCGLFVIFKVNLFDHATTFDMLYSSALLLLTAALADLLDGAVARVIHAESEFGTMFDSLADAISFGLAPAVLFLKSLDLGAVTGLSFYAILGAMLYSLCGVLRLVRYNVKEHEVKGDKSAQIAYRKIFTGLPIPAAAAATVSANLFFHSRLGETFLPMSGDVKAIVLASIMIFISYLMISRWKFPSLKTFHIRIASSHLIVCTVVIAVFFLYGILNYLSLVFFIVSWLYVLVGSLLSLVRLILGKESKVLRDFEHRDDEHVRGGK